MKNKVNVDEIKLLIPDYVSGSLSNEEKRLVEEALSSSFELKEFYDEMKGTLDFISSVKFVEPAPQYWNNLLPRIHQKIDERESRAKYPFGVIWKVLVPVAAVVLIFIVYRIITTPEPEITDKNNILITDEKKKDTVSFEKKQDVKEEKIAKVTGETKREKIRGKDLKEESVPAVEERNLIEQVQKKEEKVTPEYTIDDYASLGLEDELILGAGEPGVYDEETENELGRLDTRQQDIFLEELSKSNL
jgi:hypothetical protein